MYLITYITEQNSTRFLIQICGTKSLVNSSLAYYMEIQLEKIMKLERNVLLGF
jgi:hypothetical protein